MSDHKNPHDVKKFTINTFVAFVIMFVFAMLMMLWRGNTSRDAEGHVLYHTRIMNPGDGTN